MKFNNLTLEIMRPLVLSTFLLGLWLTLFLGLQSGNIRDVARIGLDYQFLQGFRATFPLIAASAAVLILVIKIPRERPEKYLFLGPLGLLAAYGFVGAIASLLSPKGLDSLYWAISYLSVPLVLWAIVWRQDPFQWAERLVKLNWSIVIFAMIASFTFGLIYLNFGSFILSPGNWLDCTSQPWFDTTSHFIRDTGVGRYAALTGIISLSRLWNPKFRSLWALVFFASMILLLYSGARTAMVGFIVAVPLIVLISGGKKAVLGSVIAGSILTPLVLTTGIHNDFLDNCIFRRVITSEPIQIPGSIPSPTDQPVLLAIGVDSTAMNEPSESRDDPSGSSLSPSVIKDIDNAMIGTPPTSTLDNVATDEPSISEHTIVTVTPGSHLSGAAKDTDNTKNDTSPVSTPDNAVTNSSSIAEDTTVTVTPGSHLSGVTKDIDQSTKNSTTSILGEDKHEKISSEPVASTAETKSTKETLPTMEINTVAKPANNHQYKSLETNGERIENTNEITPSNADTVIFGRIPTEFFNFTGRTAVWRDALALFSESPWIGYGFQADRYLLQTHAHNSVVQSLLQAGIVGTIPFVVGLLLAWMLLLKASINRVQLSTDQRSLLLQVLGMITFLSVRSVSESTGAFFGVDWLLLGPMLIYLQVINSKSHRINGREHSAAT